MESAEAGAIGTEGLERGDGLVGGEDGAPLRGMSGDDQTRV